MMWLASQLKRIMTKTLCLWQAGFLESIGRLLSGEASLVSGRRLDVVSTIVVCSSGPALLINMKGGGSAASPSGLGLLKCLSKSSLHGVHLQLVARNHQ